MPNALDRGRAAFSDPAWEAAEVSPSDSDNFVRLPKAIWVVAAGDVVFVPAGQDAPVGPYTFAAGDIIPVVCKRINDTNTTATVVALYD